MYDLCAANRLLINIYIYIHIYIYIFIYIYIYIIYVYSQRQLLNTSLNAIMHLASDIF